VIKAIHDSAPVLLTGGGVFLVLLFLHWIFLEPKEFGLKFEPFIYRQGIWFYTMASLFLLVIVYLTINYNPHMAFSAVVGSTAFFITHGFKSNAEEMEAELTEKKGISDLSKILYLEVIDATFSIDGVLGAFAFTLSVPLILIGNGLGAVVVRQMTIGNLDRIKRLIYLKNGAMYSILFLGTIMILESFGVEIPHYVSPVVTFGVIGFFYIKSLRENNSK
jgi:hypothetical protein